MEDKNDAFLEYLSRRLTHHHARLEKVSKYKAMEPSQLNTDQLNALADGEKSEGKREETEFLKEKYKAHVVAQAELQESLLEEAKKQARVEAFTDFTKSLSLLSTFLNSMSLQYKEGISSIPDTRVAFASFKLLELFYSGNEQGSQAMKNFIEGSNKEICENGVKFEELSAIFEKADLSGQALDPKSLSILGSDSNEVDLPETNATNELKAKRSFSSDSSSRGANQSEMSKAKVNEPQEVKHSGDEGAEDQFQIVGANKAKDKLKTGTRRRGNLKKKQSRQGKQFE